MGDGGAASSRDRQGQARASNRSWCAGRQVFDDATYDAEHYPHLVTMLNVDAPTRRQFDLPWQPKSRDTSKGLEGSKQEVGIQSNRACVSAQTRRLPTGLFFAIRKDSCCEPEDPEGKTKTMFHKFSFCSIP